MANQPQQAALNLMCARAKRKYQIAVMGRMRRHSRAANTIMGGDRHTLALRLG
jgi:hypothetical protein